MGTSCMNILLLHNYYQQPGGEDQVFEAEKALLKRAGHQVLTYERHNDEIKTYSLAQKLGLVKRTLWAKDSAQAIRDILKRERPDVAHFHNTFLLISPSAYYACWEARVPVIQTLHNYRLLCPAATFFRSGQVCENCLSNTPPWPGVAHGCWRSSRAKTAVVAMMLAVHRWLKTWEKQVHLYIAPTEFARRKFIEGGLPAEKIVVKPNFVDSDELQVTNDEWRKGKRGYALFVGRLSPEKGVRTLLRAWQKTKEIPLKVVGDGPLMGEVQAFLEREGLEGVEVLGHREREEVLRLMRGAWFLVFPSEWYEGFPLTIAEAFACGVPVIASRLGAMAEIVEDGRTGLHFEPGNSEDLVAKVEWAWTHPKEMQEMGQEARREYEEKYTAERNYEMLMEIYQRAMEEARSGG